MHIRGRWLRHLDESNSTFDLLVLLLEPS